MTIACNWKRGAEFLGTDHPILCGAMAWVSEHNLVSSISNTGGFGVLAGGSLSLEQLLQEIRKTRELTDKPFGVNIISLHPGFDDLVNVCKSEKVSHVFIGAGIPSKSIIESIKESGAVVICFAPSAPVAKKLISNGASAIVIEGSEAGGHIGPVSTSVLVQEILPEICELVPVFVAGGIGCGKMVKMYMEMGACGCQIGTRFVCSFESRAHINAKNAFIKASSREAISSVQIDKRLNILPVRALKNIAMEKFIDLQKELITNIDEGSINIKDAQMRLEYFWAGSLKKALIDGDIENGSLMAGQSVGLIKEIQTCEEIIKEIVKEVF